jgi:hypothetical protein
MTAVLSASTVVVDEPGVYDISVEDYFADPVPGGSISSSGARKLLPPSCPAKYRWEQDHPGPTSKRHFDLGHAAHMLVLGAGPELVVIDADNYRTKTAQTAQTEAHAEGAVPLLVHEHDQVQAMSAAIRRHPIAGPLFNPEHGTPEVSIFWHDTPTGIMRRARFDWLPHQHDGRRLIIPDYKTARSADPETFARDAWNHGYFQQADFYLDGAQALGLADANAAFVFVVQEKDPPYVVGIFEPDSTSLQIARFLNRQAIEIYAECMSTGNWPPYSTAVELMAMPVWVERQFMDDIR